VGLYACGTDESTRPVSASPAAARLGRVQEGMKPLALAPVLVALLAACSQPPADAAPVFADLPAELASPAPDLLVWPADPELGALTLTAAERIERATGLTVAVSDSYDGVPMFWSSAGEDQWLGFTHGEHGQAEWVAVEPHTPASLRTTVVLHELLHALGAAHVGTGEGVLSPELWIGRKWLLTAPDLGAVCAARECSAFVPESE
jgi:hypothetical protein